MSAQPVDVFGAVRVAECHLSRYAQELKVIPRTDIRKAVDSLREVRAAVAELVEHHRWALDLIEEIGLSELSLRAQHMHAECRAALARIGGTP